MSTPVHTTEHEAFGRLKSDSSPRVVVAHHFESPQHQFDAGKLGMWIFLATEVLFFGGLFVAYVIFRNTHPEVFVDASKHLSTTLGALNTAVLILSSLAMAWAVRCAQLGQHRGLLWNLAATLACAGFFLGVKAVEYQMKWTEGLLWAGAYSPTKPTMHGMSAENPLVLPAAVAAISLAAASAVASSRSWFKAAATGGALAAALFAFWAGLAVAESVVAAEPHLHDSSSTLAANETEGIADSKDGDKGGVFFSIYFSMTALHAVHILIGMGVLAWLVWSAAGLQFGPHRFAPVDFVGLYWHLVDLVWIFLFPLLYLIQ